MVLSKRINAGVIDNHAITLPMGKASSASKNKALMVVRFITDHPLIKSIKKFNSIPNKCFIIIRNL